MAWIGREILPHEADLRAWLRRAFAAAGDVDDIVQETYCRLAGLSAVEHIGEPRAYFFQAARSVALEQLRRARVVRIDTAAEIDALNVELDEPSPERIAGGRR
ncbi:MAG: sigma factor, partial [Caulobacter sp.]